MRYLAAAGLSPAALRKYRGARKTKASVLLTKRSARSRKSGRPRESFKVKPFLVNRGGRKVGSYARFVKSFHSRTGMSGPSLMKAAGRAWRGGARRNILPAQMLTNPVLPYASFNKKRGRKGKRGGRRNPVLPYASFNKKRGRSRRNPVLPYASFNEGASENPIAGIEAGLKQALSVNFWTETVLPLGAGFIGGQFVGGIAYSFISKLTGKTEGTVGAIQRIGARALGSVAVSAVALMLPIKNKRSQRDIAGKVLAGGLVSVLAAILQELFGADTYSKMTGMSDFADIGQDITDELKNRIAESVRGEIARAESGIPNGTSAFVSTQDLAPAPDLGPGPRVGEMGSFVSTQDLRTAPVAGDQPMVADLSAFSDNFADMMLV